jgi:hypothetical protein
MVADDSTIRPEAEEQSPPFSRVDAGTDLPPWSNEVPGRDFDLSLVASVITSRSEEPLWISSKPSGDPKL